jgi:hypothetical protein
MSTKLKKLPSGGYVLNSNPRFYFTRKPPDWIVPDLERIYKAGVERGERNIKGPLRNTLRDWIGHDDEY